MVSLPEFNIIRGFGIDYMHCVLLGVVRGLLKMWTSPQLQRRFFGIDKYGQLRLSNRISSIKPLREFSRMPRSLKELSDFKANEFRSLLLYYLPICLKGVLPQKYVEHFSLLSSAIFILLKDNISADELDEAEDKLEQFVKKYEIFYGKIKMTMNVHLLRHLPDNVRNLGPLWSYSAFAYESYNGVLLNHVNGTRDVMHQIASKYLLSKSIPLEKPERNYKISFLGKSIEYTEASPTVLTSNGDVINILNPNFAAYKRIQINTTVYTSLIYTRAKKTRDNFLRLKNTTIGSAKYYLEYNKEIYVMLNQYKIKRKDDHIWEVEPGHTVIMALAKDIEQKLIRIDMNNKVYATFLPNRFEKD